MPHLNMLTAYEKQKRLLTQPLMLALLLMTLLLIWPTASAGQDAPADSVLVPTTLLIGAREEIDELERIVAKQDSLLVAQRDYYIELLALKDQRVEILEKSVKDALGSPTKAFLEKLIWGLAGYGLHAAGD